MCLCPTRGIDIELNKHAPSPQEFYGNFWWRFTWKANTKIYNFVCFSFKHQIKFQPSIYPVLVIQRCKVQPPSPASICSTFALELDSFKLSTISIGISDTRISPQGFCSTPTYIVSDSSDDTGTFLT